MLRDTLNHPVATLDKSRAKLTHRVHLDDVPVLIPASGWDCKASGTTIHPMAREPRAN